METAGDGKCVQFIFKPQKATLYYTIKAILHHFYIISVLTSLPPEHQRANGFPTILATSGTHGCWLPHHPNNPGTRGCWLPHHPNNTGHMTFVLPTILTAKGHLCTYWCSYHVTIDWCFEVHPRWYTPSGHAWL